MKYSLKENFKKRKQLRRKLKFAFKGLTYLTDLSLQVIEIMGQLLLREILLFLPSRREQLI